MAMVIVYDQYEIPTSTSYKNTTPFCRLCRNYCWKSSSRCTEIVCQLTIHSRTSLSYIDLEVCLFGLCSITPSMIIEDFAQLDTTCVNSHHDERRPRSRNYNSSAWNQEELSLATHQMTSRLSSRVPLLKSIKTPPRVARLNRLRPRWAESSRGGSRRAESSKGDSRWVEIMWAERVLKRGVPGERSPQKGIPGEWKLCEQSPQEGVPGERSPQKGIPGEWKLSGILKRGVPGERSPQRGFQVSGSHVSRVLKSGFQVSGVLKKGFQVSGGHVSSVLRRRVSRVCNWSRIASRWIICSVWLKRSSKPFV